MKPFFTNFRLTFERTLELIIETNYLLIIFLIPVWFSYLFPTYNMFELGKLLVFRFLLWSLLIFSILWLINKSRLKKIVFKLKGEGLKSVKQLFWPPLLLIAGLSFLTFLSIDPLQSFWGSYTRQQGLYSYLNYFLWAIIIFVNLIGIKILKGEFEFKKRIKRIIVAVVLSGGLVAIYGILQIMNIDFFSWPEAPYITGRALSSLGQPNFLASFLLLTIPLCFYLTSVTSKRFLHFFYLLLGAIQIICLYYTLSRGGLFAFFAVIGIFSLGVLLFSHLKKKTKIIIVVSLITFIFLSLSAIETLNPGRIKSSIDIKSGSIAARVYFFQASANAILEKPIFGYGLENSSDVFIKYYERDWGLHGTVGSNTDRAHNIILDVLITSGFIGLIIFSFWYYSIFRLGINEIRKKKNTNLAIALSLAVFGYLVSLLFSFTVVAGEVYLWLFFAILASLSLKIEASVGGQELNDKVSFIGFEKIAVYFSAVFLIIASIFGIYSNYKLVLADYYLNTIYIAVNKMEFVQALELYKMAYSLNTNSTQEKKLNKYLGDNLMNYVSYGSLKDFSEKVYINEGLQNVLKELPDKSYENLFLKARINSYFENNEKADHYFNEVASISPNWPLNYLEWGRHYLKNENLELAEKSFQLVDINLPDLDSKLINEEHKQMVRSYKYVMYSQIGAQYLRIGNYKRANNFLQEAYRNNPEDYTILKKIADSYYLQGDLDLAIKYNIYGAQSDPVDYNWQIALAVLYYEKGDVAKSLQYLDEAYKLAPAEKKAEIEGLRNDYFKENKLQDKNI